MEHIPRCSWELVPRTTYFGTLPLVSKTHINVSGPTRFVPYINRTFGILPRDAKRVAALNLNYILDIYLLTLIRQGLKVELSAVGYSRGNHVWEHRIQ